jgi:hypothetical protein
MTIYGASQVPGVGQIPDTATIDKAEQQFLQAMGIASGDPGQAPNGTVAAEDLLNPNNPFFNNPLLYKDDPGYNPEAARAEAFVATLADYDKTHNFKALAQFLVTLGRDEIHKLTTEAENLQGPVIDDNGVTIARTPQNVAGWVELALQDVHYDNLQPAPEPE